MFNFFDWNLVAPVLLQYRFSRKLDVSKHEQPRKDYGKLVERLRD